MNSKSAQNYAFLISFLIFSQKIWSYQHFLKTSKPNAQKRLKKSKNIFCKCVLVSIFHLSKGLCSSFSKKQSNSLYPSAHTYFLKFAMQASHIAYFFNSYAQLMLLQLVTFCTCDACHDCVFFSCVQQELGRRLHAVLWRGQSTGGSSEYSRNVLFFSKCFFLSQSLCHSYTVFHTKSVPHCKRRAGENPI